MRSPLGGSQRLPVWLSQFFGRQDETAELAHLVEDVRLLTLMGAPGSGKTRLSAELAEVVAPGFRTGSGCAGGVPRNVSELLCAACRSWAIPFVEGVRVGMAGPSNQEEPR